MVSQSSPPSSPPGKPPGDSDFGGTGELTLPELEKVEETPFKKEAPITDLGPKHVDLAEKPQPEALADPGKQEKDHPELKYQEPPKPKTTFNLPPIKRSKLDGWGMVGAFVGLLLLISSPVFLDFMSESPLGHLTDAGVEVHVSIVPSSSLATGIWLNGFRVPYERDLVIHVPFNGSYKLEIKREGFETFEKDLTYIPSKKKESEEKELVAQLVPLSSGILNISATSPCALEVGDGVSFWQLKTPVRELKLPPADYIVKFTDPNCNDKQFYVPVREGSRSYVVWEFGQGDGASSSRQPAGH